MKMPEKFFFHPKDNSFDTYYALKYKDLYFVSHRGEGVCKWSEESLKQKFLNGTYTMALTYKWQSDATGEVVENFWKVIRAIWIDLTKFHFLNIKWKYKKGGF